MAKKGTIYKRGNGFPNAGDYVQGDDGQLYRVVSLGSRIETGTRSGESNHIPGCTVKLADWSDIDGDDGVHSSALTLDSDASVREANAEDARSAARHARREDQY